MGNNIYLLIKDREYYLSSIIDWDNIYLLIINNNIYSNYRKNIKFTLIIDRE